MRPIRATALLVALVTLGGCTQTAADPSASPAGSAPASAVASTTPRASIVASAGPSASAQPSEAPGASAGPSEPASATTYTVQRGDTLYGIATRFATSVAQLQAWNAERYPSLASDPNRLEPGWTLVVAGEPGVTPRPAPVPTPRPTGAAPPPPPPSGGLDCSAGNRVAAGSPQTFSTIPNAGPGVALTFDMGGRMDPAVDIMTFLVENEVCATIFATGVMSQTTQGRQVMAIIAAHPELFEIANHTMYHCDLARGGGGSPTTGPCQTGGAPSADFIRRELTDAEAILREGTGQNPQPYWRPPYGSLSSTVIDAAASVGYTKTFMWDIDTIDWRPIADGGPTAEQIASKVITRAVNGSNVLFHLGGFETLDALRIIVPGLRDRGFTLTSLSDLLD